MVFKKFLLYIRGFIFYILKKTRYRERFNCYPIIAIDGKIILNIYKNGLFESTNIIRVDGPLYVKCIGKILIGTNTYFNRNCSITAIDEILIGDNCYFGNNVVVVDHNHSVLNGCILPECIADKVIIENNVWIGANSVILKGVTIGEGSIVGAGSVVTKPIPKHSIAVGNPARVIKKIEE